MMFSSMPTAYMMPMLVKVLSGMVIAATMAERMGNRIIITRMITIIDSIKSRRKS